MLPRHRVVGLASLVMLAALSGMVPPTSAGDKDAPNPEVKVAGILFDLDRKNHWLTVKADGEDEPVKYLIDPTNPRTAKALESIFNASRVRLIYRKDGESRRLVAVERQILQESGTVTGDVVKVHNDFWIELKPKRGLANAFAPGANYNDKDFMAKLKALKPGDSVTIQYTTDFERHRIARLRKNAPQAQPAAKAEPKGTPAKKK